MVLVVVQLACSSAGDIGSIDSGDDSAADSCTLACDGAQRCGNGTREGAEVCDGEELGGPLDCADIGYKSGSLSCKADCTAFEVSSCVGTQTGCNGLPIIDTHAHIWPDTEAKNTQYIQQLVQVAISAGVGKILLGLHARHVSQRPPTYSTNHDKWILTLAATYPDIIVPMLGGFDPADPKASDYVDAELTSHPAWKGIGELDLRNKPKQTVTPANSKEMMEIYAVAAKHKVPVLIHHDVDYGTKAATGLAELKDALTKNPNTKFIFAHGCLPELMEDHSNLFCEFEIGGKEDIPAKFADRVILGTDIQSPDLSIYQPPNSSTPYKTVIGDLCSKVKVFPYPTQKKITHTTAEQLFGITK
jgi:Amidohydrolase